MHAAAQGRHLGQVRPLVRGEVADLLSQRDGPELLQVAADRPQEGRLPPALDVGHAFQERQREGGIGEEVLEEVRGLIER